ncbi:hypothetical protein CLAIMM_03471 [Cladophialophora immunda]|nr:hypothetical protein CLAIMM_03471 [Cladophialophora immunda]
MGSKPNTGGEGVETPVEEEARLSQELAELQRPQRLLKLKAQIEAARKGSPISDERAQPCCLTILRAEENAHSETRAQLDQKSRELDNLQVEYSGRGKELVDIKSKLKQVEDELKAMTQARDKEKIAHNQTQASLKAMTDSRDQERTAHGKTTASLKATIGQRDQEQTAHNHTKATLRSVTQSRDKEQAAHEQTKATLQTVTESRDQERTAHTETKAALKEVTDSRDLEHAAHNRTKVDLTTMTASRDEEQAAHRRTQADLDAMTESRDEARTKCREVAADLKDAEADLNDAREERKHWEELATRAVPPPVRDIRFQDGYPKAADGGWTLLNDSYKINHKGEIAGYSKKGWGRR